MKKFISFSLSMLIVTRFAASSHGSEIVVTGACDSKPVAYIQGLAHPAGVMLGDLTVSAFQTHAIRYSGGRTGIKSIFDSPVGNAALEVVDESLSRAYGWCVSIDGKQVDKMPDQVPVNNHFAKIEWFYAYAVYDHGKWTQFCVPSHKLRSPFICKDGPGLLISN